MEPKFKFPKSSSWEGINVDPVVPVWLVDEDFKTLSGFKPEDVGFDAELSKLGTSCSTSGKDIAILVEQHTTLVKHPPCKVFVMDILPFACGDISEAALEISFSSSRVSLSCSNGMLSKSSEHRRSITSFSFPSFSLSFFDPV